jgi:hypothetical protein
MGDVVALQDGEHVLLAPTLAIIEPEHPADASW